MRTTILCLTLALIGAAELAAGLNFDFPRTRFFSELGRPKRVQYGSRTVRRPSGGSLKQGGLYDTSTPRFGVETAWTSDYQWRDFLLSTSDRIYTLDAYGSFQGFEASVFAVRDFSDRLGDEMLAVEYGAAYTYVYETSINTLGYTFLDWTDAPGTLGLPSQGFGKTPINFSREQHELALHSYWFDEKLQQEGANYFVGIDARYNFEGAGLRGQGVVGIFAHKSGLHSFLPNASRVAASLIFQSRYFTETSTFPGSNFLLEMMWDAREEDLPFMGTFAVEYYLPWGDDQFRERLMYIVKLSLLF